MEGNLPESLIDQFLDFLNQNPDLKEELHLFEEIKLPQEFVVFQEKKQLHKSLADENSRLENTVVAYMEGDLDANENKVFETFLAGNPELKKEYDLFARTRLKPDSGIKYPKKRKLYRKSGATIVMNWVARAAAVILLAWGINSVIQTPNSPESQKTKMELAGALPKATPNAIAKKAESKETIQTAAGPAKSKPEKVNTVQKKTKIEPEETRPIDSPATTLDLTALTQIDPIVPKLDQEPLKEQLAFSRAVNMMKINESKNVMSVEEFLASRVQKVGKEGLFSAQRIARLGLNLASEISGERIGYEVKNGKITSVDFESKLMAFSIPLEKK
ncbi:hypothetical protein AQPE_2353 [Aquipluma nitroreducens]|uniref:Uncharacterized protein n=2 Tax=Aquipluma nitroreducens TaxID=2010828 RepID=A0A5K7S9E2_9BACT|nr:hypothetical protein AQPE_2353 [Aquipluma nitroreducens]